MISSISLTLSLDEYSNVKPFLLQELDHPDGITQGEITGPIADKFRTTTKSMSPVIVNVTTLKRFKQPGCNRLNLSLRQDNYRILEKEFDVYAVKRRAKFSTS